MVSSTTDKVSTIARVKCHTQGRTELRLNSNITTATATVSVKNKMDPTTIDSAAIETTTGSVVADSSTTSKSVVVDVATQAIAKNSTPTPFFNLKLNLKVKFRLKFKVTIVSIIQSYDY